MEKARTRRELRSHQSGSPSAEVDFGDQAQSVARKQMQKWRLKKKREREYGG